MLIFHGLSEAWMMDYRWFIRSKICFAADILDAVSELQNKQLNGHLQWIGTIAKPPS
jgi:hypothetical protein